jgi:hypothetical protein
VCFIVITTTTAPPLNITLNYIDMKRVDIFSISASDAKALMQMQTRLNQWLTADTLIKYDIHTTSEYVIFNVCRKKEQE